MSKAHHFSAVSSKDRQGTIRSAARVSGKEDTRDLKCDPLHQAKPLGHSTDGLSTCDHDALLYRKGSKSRKTARQSSK
jgi:hypothetical protein